MTFQKNSLASASAPDLNDLLLLTPQRQLQQQSRSSPPEHEESDYFRTTNSLLRSFTTLRNNGSGPTSTSRYNLRSILDRAIALLDESDDEGNESSVISRPRSDSNSEQH
jgi:hypothetical protein